MIDPPLEITDFLDRLHTTAQRTSVSQSPLGIVPGSLIWLPHPTKPGWWVPAVGVEDERKEKMNDESHRH